MRSRIMALGVAAVVLAGCGGGSDVVVDATVLQGFEVLPASFDAAANPMTPEKVVLGRMLYYDTRLSTTGDISCYVCHPLHDYGVSHRSTGVGHNALVGGRNEPTVYNAAGHIAQFWDGRAADVEEQALGPVTNPVEMGMPDGASVMDRLRGIPGYVEAFRAAFPGDSDPMTFENVGLAIGAFERGLVTPSRWDAYLSGDRGALTDREKQGLETFVELGCAACHTGAFVGGQAYQKVGLVRPWFDQSDEGRFAVTGNEADRMVFKVPSLRNVEETWPYFHDGSVQRLQDAIRLMSWHQLGREPTEEEAGLIVAWLRTLTGPVPYDYINEPELPAEPAAESIALR